MFSSLFIAYMTMVKREVSRFTRVWLRTMLPPMMNTWLYFLIFGNLIGQKIGPMAGYSYVEFMMPGLIIMSVIVCSFTNVASSLYSARFQKYIEDVLTAPIPDYLIVLGFVSGGLIRGVLVGCLVFMVAAVFAHIEFFALIHVILMLIFSSLMFSLGGFINAAYARNFDDVSIIPTLMLSPLIYLGGVFYTVDILPPFWENVSRFNPLLYVINTFRYGFLGVSDTSLTVSYAIVLICTVALFIWAVILLHKGKLAGS